ncbi:histamine N-methyltransferase A-like [Ptychodera flava]|uniref:histamine N-methyltransferase A-like n=1 Tax=Ptychodera flava TaxID=63121 RepID=UPI00396A15A8
MASSFKSIYCDMDYYFDAYRTISEKTKCPAEHEWMAHWESIIEILSKSIQPGDDIRMLAVAAGNGFFEQKIVKILANMFQTSSVSVEIVEPAKKQLDKFKTNAPDVTNTFPNVSFKWFEDNFEEYMVKRQNNGCHHKFHLLLCINGIYYMEDWRSVIDQFYNLLMPAGIMVNSINSSKSARGILSTRYREWEEVAGNQLTSDDITQCALMLTSDDITNHLKTKGISYHGRPRERANDITDVFDEQSADGNMILDFIAQTKNFRQNAPKNLLQKVLDYLRKNSREESGRRLICDDEIDIVIIKSIYSP